MKHLFSSETWSSMRTLLAALLTLGILLCLLLAGCTPYADDDADKGRGTGVALSLGSVTVAEQKDGKQGVDTRADTPVDGLEQWPGFRTGDILYVGIASGSLQGGGKYQYHDDMWLATRNSAYWQSGAAKNTVRITNKEVGDYTLPDSYEADAASKWNTWDILTYQEENVAPVSPYSFELQHAMAQLCVELAPGTEIKTDQLQSATVKALNADCKFSISLFEGDEPLQKQSGTPKSITLLKNGATSLKHYALLLPEQNYAAAQKMIEINIGNDSYSFTPTEALMLKAGTCLHLTLTVSKTGVSGWTVRSTSWDDEVTTGGKPGEDSEVTVIENTAGGLEATLNSFSGTKLMITGEINDADMGALKEAIKNKNITEVYITATGVTDLGKEAFSGCITLESISMPGVTGSIGDAAFEGCTALQSVSMPRVTGSIGYAAFSDCNTLQSISLPEVTKIGNSTFQYCTALESVNLPKTTEIGNVSFADCTALKSVNLPKVTSLEEGYAFSTCTALENISLPQVTILGGSTFEGCTALKNVSLPKVTSIEAGLTFSNCTALESISLPEMTGDIGNSTFKGCIALKSVSLPKITGSIEGYAFWNCTALESINMPKVTGSIKYAAFEGCTALQSVSMPKVTGSIGDYAFNGCKALESINMPKATGSIGGYAFKGCTALKSISMPKAAGSIGNYAFNGCTALESISLPKVTSIGSVAFQGCTSLESIVLSGYDLNQNQVSLPTTVDNAFMDCPISILFLRDVPKGIDANTVAAACQSWADVSWKAIHYDYDDLNDDTDVGSYSGHWLRP